METSLPIPPGQAIPPAAPILPPATIGILGGGQLGRMLGMAARAMGYRVAVLDPDPDCPAAAIADEIVVASYEDAYAAIRLAAVSDVVTYELEHVAAEVVEAIVELVPVRPGDGPLVVTQDRLAERIFVEAAGIAVAPWRDRRHDLRPRQPRPHQHLPPGRPQDLPALQGRDLLRPGEGLVQGGRQGLQLHGRLRPGGFRGFLRLGAAPVDLLAEVLRERGLGVLADVPVQEGGHPGADLPGTAFGLLHPESFPLMPERGVVGPGEPVQRFP
jgi:hypothetical protein